ncbi:MAG TPA: HAD-IA family hydrolase [Spirochaetia bacterium]|nr:HAD-IA family hydrolase [Spirochaetia bacterium]
MPRFRAVLFDFDGTLTHPDALDFPALRKALECPPGTLILEHIAALPTAEERDRKHRILAEFELAAARASVPNDAAEETVAALRRAGLAVGILTRNTRSSVLASLANFHSTREDDFGVIVTRESGGRPKPHPDGVLSAAQALAVEPARMLVVGDFVFDIAAGAAAGAATALLTNGRAASGPTVPMAAVPDYTIGSLRELAAIIGIPALPSP